MPKLEPFLRWVGSKRRLLELIIANVPPHVNRYIEPFLGGGAIFLRVLQEGRARSYHLSDLNPHLINLWRIIQSDVDGLVGYLDDQKTKLAGADHRESYLANRDEFNAFGPDVDPLRHAGLFLTLNKTCFNGLVRYNGRGEFNSACGSWSGFACDEKYRELVDKLRRLSGALNASEVYFSTCSFEQSVEHCECGDFFYFDPPYLELDDRTMGQCYHQRPFTRRDEAKLRNYCDRITGAGGKFLLSNHECREILDTFRGYRYLTTTTCRKYTGKSSSRLRTSEILLGNALGDTSDDDIYRICNSRMEFYRQVYADSPRWTENQDIADKTVIVYCEEGYGDVVQFMRYIPLMRSRCRKLILHCPSLLIPLFEIQGWDVEFVPKESPELPEHDYHVLSMSLPFALGLPDVPDVYLRVPPRDDLPEGFRVGIAWEGSGAHSTNFDRSCPLRHWKELFGLPVSVFMLQPKRNYQYFSEGCDDLVLYGDDYPDFLATARMIASMDLVVTVDTSIVHLAGAMGKPTVCLLSNSCDYRWFLPKPWYRSVEHVRQPEPGAWEPVLAEAVDRVKARLGLPVTERVSCKHGRRPSVLITGGIGDVLAMEPYFPEYFRTGIRVYYATGQAAAVREILHRVCKIVGEEVLWTDFSNGPVFYKWHLTQMLWNAGRTLPEDWAYVEDWSILRKFFEIEGVLETGKSRVMTEVLAEVPDYGDYVVVCPASDNQYSYRDFDESDWEAVATRLDRLGLKGLVLGGHHVSCTGMVNLSGMTSILDSVELVKRARGYFGIDSCLSVIAARLFPDDMLWVKSNHAHLNRWKHIYYEPKQDFGFISTRFAPSPGVRPAPSPTSLGS